MKTHQPHLVKFPHYSAWLVAVAMLVLTGCGKGKEQANAIAPHKKDLRRIITDELATGKKRIVIPPGRYHVQADHGGHLVFSNLKDVEINAENVELVCTSTVRAILFDHCINVTLRGLVVDYDPLPFSQGKIVAMAPDKSWLEFQVAQGYPKDKLREPFQIYNPASGALRRDDARWNDQIEALGGDSYRVRKADSYRFAADQDTEQVGDIIVCKNTFGKPGSPHAVELRGCKGMRFEDVTIHASPSFGFLERHSDSSTYLRCIVDRRSPENDPIKRALPRIRSLNADAFHSKDATKGPAIISCTARFMGDDAVNINGRYHYVRGSKGRELRVAIIDRTSAIKVGDPVEFLPYSGPRPPDAKVVQRRVDPEPLTGEEKTFIRQLRMDNRMRNQLLEARTTFHTFTLDRQISLPPGSLVCCPLRLGNGFVVKDGDFGDNRSRGILIKASDGEVSGNRITNTRMAAVLVSPEFWWMEAGCSSDLVIKNNTIKGSLKTPIQIHARGGNRRFLPAGAMRNISVLNNRIEDSAWPLIHVTSTSGLKIEGNILPAAPPEKMTGTHANPAESILLEFCETKP